MRLGINTLFMVPGDVGGTETYLRETLLAALQTYPETRFVLFTNRENDQLLRTLGAGNQNVTYVNLGLKAASRPLRIIFEQTRLPLIARRHRLDLLWSPGYTAPFLAPCPQVVTVCDLQYKSYPEDLSTLERVTLDILVRGACRRCDAVLAISEFSRQEILRYGFAGPDRVHAVPLGVDPSFARPISEAKKKAQLKKLLPSATTPFILCVAHTYPHKMVHVLIEAFNQVMNRIPHHLVLVGRARRGEPRVRQAIVNSSDQRRIVRFDRGLPHRTLQLLYQAADMFVLPSVYEGFGLPVLEAMMAGTPVITTSEASLVEVAGEHAFRVGENNARAFAEQIIRMYTLDRSQRSRLIEAASAWAQTFTWQRSARQMFSIFQKVAGRKTMNQRMQT